MKILEELRQADGSAGLGAEWARICHLVAMTEALRAGLELTDEFAAGFKEINEQTLAGREGGAWQVLSQITDDILLKEISSIDLDLLALALAPESMPALAWRLQALQGHLVTPYPSLALVQELLLLDTSEDIDRLLMRLTPDAPLIAAGLLSIEGSGVWQTLTPGPGVARAVLGRDLDLGPPPGTHLVNCHVSWDDLIVPVATRNSLSEFIAWIRQGKKVFGDWQGRRIGGPLALFCGASGVGKTMAASVVAQALDWPLYVLDLGRIMSKYIGETEKNINRVLDAMHCRPAVLQIDEADGFLGKRGEIINARDRWANLGVSHLLSRLERHQGPVIMTTNLRANLDRAFLRRFQLVVDFPKPDVTARAELWRRLLPPCAPRDESLSCEELGQAVELNGGAIHNAAIHAAMLAADEDSSLGPRHVALAIWRELGKENRPLRRVDLGCLADYLPQGEAL
jgi:hypothetical protein